MASLFMIMALFAFLLQGGLQYPFNYLIQYGAILNSILGLFNMIPIPPFDGARVMLWKKRVWGGLLVVLLALLILSYEFIPMLWA
jgi:Zn-dependent protease